VREQQARVRARDTIVDNKTFTDTLRAECVAAGKGGRRVEQMRTQQTRETCNEEHIILKTALL
jgi:hypothetical protein